MNYKIFSQFSHYFLIVLVLFVFSSTDLFANSDNDLSELEKNMPLAVQKNEFKIMSYNLLNLFDTLQDPGKQDYTWLPKSHPQKIKLCQKITSSHFRKECLTTDWTNSKLNLKLNQIKKVIQLQGPLPELFATQEIENENVAKELAYTLGYNHLVISNSDDNRGIDVALFFKNQKLKYLAHEEINVSKIVGFATRPILRVDFQIIEATKEQFLSVYVNHWPSQRAPSVKRVIVAKRLKIDIEIQFQKYGKDKYSVILVGDYNTTASENPNAIKQLFDVKDKGFKLEDAFTLAQKTNHPLIDLMPEGTYWYGPGNSYHSYDRIIFNQSLLEANNSVQVLPHSFRIVATKLNSRFHNFLFESLYLKNTKSHLIPKSYNFKTNDPSRAGFSDHYPVVLKFKFK